MTAGLGYYTDLYQGSKEVLLMRSIAKRGQSHHFLVTKRSIIRSVFLFIFSAPKPFIRNLIKCHNLEIMLLITYRIPISLKMM